MFKKKPEIIKKEETEERKYKIWIISTLFFSISAFIMFATITIYIDPLFHYHKPLEKYKYPINNERYQNDGITKNFEYESIITGTSMTENFKKSEADKIFGSDFIKVPFAGGHYKEINDNLKRAYNSGKNIKYIIRCLDYSHLVEGKDTYREDIEYPFYLYNSNLFDDVNYVLNKSILFEQTLGVIKHTKNCSWEYQTKCNKLGGRTSRNNFLLFFSSIQHLLLGHFKK